MTVETEVADRTWGLIINGEVVTTKDTFDVLDPSNGQVLAKAPVCSEENVERTVIAARNAFATWQLDDTFRQETLFLAADAVAAAKDVLARTLTLEQGKTLRESANEIDQAVTWLRYYAGLKLGSSFAENNESAYVEVQRRPMGVVAAITPWNFPITLAMWKIAPALRAGNTVIVKPASYTPLTTLALGEVMQSVLPPGVLSVLTGPGSLGARLVEHPGVNKVSFTGSTEVGQTVGEAAARRLKRVTLELGGNDAALVLDDADIPAIIDRLFWGAFRNNGQICVAIKRVYVHRSLHDQLVAALVEKAQVLTSGSGLNASTDLGPMCNEAQLDRVAELVDDARQRGAVIATGGGRIDLPGYFYKPTIVTNIRDGFRLVDEEQFGPALPIIAVDNDAEAIEKANASPFGLTSSVWSSDIKRAMRVANQLDSGHVFINQHARGLRPDVPFAGHKSSGVGVENGIQGLESYTEFRVLSHFG